VSRPLIAVLGPTGSGKSGLAIHLARCFGGEVINCDSVQVYRGFNIGTAKAAVEERGQVPHHLIDIRDPHEVFTAGDFARCARETMAGIALPILAGGTGFYVRALLEGLFAGPERNEALRAKLLDRQRRRPASVHRILGRLDPVAAARIHPNDVNKTIRAVEIAVSARKPMSELFKSGRDGLKGYECLSLGLNPLRGELYSRLDERTAKMFASGLVDEVRNLLERGVPPSAKPFESLGYSQALRLVRGEITQDQAVSETQLRTRQYAKRQWTWFRRQAGMVWLDGFGTDPAVMDQAEKKAAAFLEHFLTPSVL